MGGADYINVLYSEFLNFDPDDAEWVNRDRFFLDPGHMSPMLYATLSLIGKYSMEDLKNFRQWGSITPGHPEVDVKRGVENTSGPLGQGHAMAVGAAIAERFLVARFGEWMAHKTYAFISDGGIQEEISQGAGRIAGTLGLANLIMFYDSNNIQLSTKVDEVTHEDTAKKYEAWGWQVITIDGNDAAEIRQALKVAQEEKERPTLIIGHTLMGKGAVGADEEDSVAEALGYLHERMAVVVRLVVSLFGHRVAVANRVAPRGGERRELSVCRLGLRDGQSGWGGIPGCLCGCGDAVLRRLCGGKPAAVFRPRGEYFVDVALFRGQFLLEENGQVDFAHEADALRVLAPGGGEPLLRRDAAHFGCEQFVNRPPVGQPLFGLAAVVARGHEIGTQLERFAQEDVELDFAVAQHVGIGRAAFSVLREHIVDHACAIVGREVDYVQRDVQFLGDQFGEDPVVVPRAVALERARRIVPVYHEQSGDLVPLLLEQVSRDRRIHAA